MTPERYQLIDQIFQAALAQEPAKRTAFLGEACSGDPALREEVESLITSDGGGLSFIDDPAFDVAASLLASVEPELSAGDHVDRYEVLSLLGAGGMGEVYLAHDERLDRKIALKLLPSDFITNQARLQRFQQEARAASALNHPNIITIHEIGEVDTRHFMATEFVDGETLRERLKQSRLSVRESLEIAAQICSALSAAHQAGIVHRDIKPENIMLRQDGYVKVLDFGLAKLTQDEQLGSLDSAAESVNVSSGLLMGTVKYMSPEQAQGLPVDQRSDLFSLGVVLYEMLTGHAPFEGENSRELIRTILTDEPTLLATYLPEAPEELQRVVSKSLTKQRTDRYQSAAELLLDLKTLKEKKTSGLAQTKTWVKHHKAVAGVMLAALLIVAVGIGLWINGVFRLRGAHFQKITATKFTNFGDAWEPIISPDGKYVVYVKGSGTEGAGKFSIWLKPVGTTSELQIVPTIEGRLIHMSFSADGGNVCYSARLGNQPVAAFVVPTFGGNATKLPLKGATHVSFSPDGKRLAFLDNRLAEGKTVLVVANLDGSEPRDIFTRQAPNYYWTAVKPSWSPDGKLIACIGQNGSEGFPHVFAISLETETERAITSQKWNSSTGVAWLPDMSGLLLVAADETSSNLQVWRVSYPSGQADRITHDTVNYSGLDLTADGNTLVTTKLESPTSIWVMPIEAAASSPKKGEGFSVDTSKAKQVIATNLTAASNWQDYARLAWTPDLRLVYVSEESGNSDIWSMNADGSDRKHLTTDLHWDTSPTVSPDGRYIAFMSNRAGTESVWRMNVDGGHQTRVTNRLIERSPSFSADGTSVYFSAWETGRRTIWKISVEGGDPMPVITDLSSLPQISPDGKFLLYTGQGKVLIASSEGGPPIKSFELRGGSYQWSPDGRAVDFLWGHGSNVANLWEQPLDDTEPRQLTNFTSDGIINYAFSRDGKQLAVSRTRSISDVVLISEVK